MNNIPEPLKASPQWVLWRYGEPRPDGKRAKPPVDLHGRMIDPHKPEHWLEFSEAQAALQEEGGLFAGLGFVLSADDPLYLHRPGQLPRCSGPGHPRGPGPC